MATADFLVAGRSFAGFPLLLDDDGWPMEPAQSFLWHTLITHGGVESTLTWEAYGRRLYDYFVQQACTAHAVVQTGKFAADMQVHLVNDGPVTIPMRMAPAVVA